MLKQINNIFLLIEEVNDLRQCEMDATQPLYRKDKISLLRFHQSRQIWLFVFFIYIIEIFVISSLELRINNNLLYTFYIQYNRKQIEFL